MGLPKWCSGKESAYLCIRLRFDPWVGKISWSRKWQSVSVFLPGKFHGQRSLKGYSPWGCRVRHKWAHTHSNKQTGFLSSVIHASKSMEIKVGEMETSDLQLLGQKHSWRPALAIGTWSLAGLRLAPGSWHICMWIASALSWIEGLPAGITWLLPVGKHSPILEGPRQRTDAFELWCWRSLLRVPWTARRSNQSILKEISPEYSLEGMMLKLKLQYFDHLMWKVSSLEKALMPGKIEGRQRRGAVHGVAKSWTRLSNFTFTFHFHALEKEMATLSSVLVWRIPGTGAWWAAIYGVAESRTRLT